MLGTFFKSAGNPFLFRTMVPQVKIFLESNDLASDTDVKNCRKRCGSFCFPGQRLAFLRLLVRVLPLDTALCRGKDLAGGRIQSDYHIATILLSPIWLVLTECTASPRIFTLFICKMYQ